jgi:hypothetical protein
LESVLGSRDQTKCQVTEEFLILFPETASGVITGIPVPSPSKEEIAHERGGPADRRPGFSRANPVRTEDVRIKIGDRRPMVADEGASAMAFGLAKSVGMETNAHLIVDCIFRIFAPHVRTIRSGSLSS